MTETAAKTDTREFEGLTVPGPGTFSLDASHTTVGFLARHLMVSKVRGHFNEYEGTITIGESLLDSSVEVKIKTASIDTRDETRDAHLRSDDFFSAEKYPELVFKSTKVEHTSGSRFAVTGDLTIGEVTKPVVLEATFDGVVTDPWGGQRFGFTASTDIDRFEFGLTWNAAIEAGGLVVGKKVTIEIEVEAVRQS